MNLPKGDRAVVVSSDTDLYQLLSTRVSIWKPHKKEIYTSKDFSRDYYNLDPIQWVQVKALAGCTSDAIPGIPGVGEVTAGKFLRGLLKPASKAYQSIERFQSVWQNNLPLVRLPFEGTMIPKIQTDEVSPDKWRNLAQRLGMKSLLRDSS